MSNIQINGKLIIHPGKLAAFKQLCEQCVASVKEKDKGTLQYEWFFNESQTECRVLEAYEDSNALLAHMGNLGELLPKLLEIVDVSFEVYGNPSQDLLNAVAGLDVKLYSLYLGK